MNEKEIGELRRRIRPEKSSITHVRGCYVNENREIISQFDQSLGMMTQEETEKFLNTTEPLQTTAPISQKKMQKKQKAKPVLYPFPKTIGN